jgi:hypothetical protein
MAELKHKTDLIPFDTLELVNKAEGGTRWKGSKGTYFFKTTGFVEPFKPVRFIYLNHKYMTGLFGTKNPKVFNGDLKTENGKIYLLFKIKGETINIYQKQDNGLIAVV